GSDLRRDEVALLGERPRARILPPRDERPERRECGLREVAVERGEDVESVLPAPEGKGAVLRADGADEIHLQRLDRLRRGRVGVLDDAEVVERDRRRAGDGGGDEPVLV